MGAKGKAFYERGVEAAKKLEANHPESLKVSLFYAVFTESILGDRKNAIRIAKLAHNEGAKANVSTTYSAYDDAQRLLTNLRDYVVVWEDTDSRY